MPPDILIIFFEKKATKYEDNRIFEYEIFRKHKNNRHENFPFFITRRRQSICFYVCPDFYNGISKAGELKKQATKNVGSGYHPKT
jgi:hypothetical protein